jgi:hypothetical protein
MSSKIRNIPIIMITGLLTMMNATAIAKPFDSEADYFKTCTVQDPTGTSLNVRERPNGRIIDRLANGSEVLVLSMVRDRNGKIWIALPNGDSEAVRGYVLRKYLVNCVSSP